MIINFEAQQLAGRIDHCNTIIEIGLLLLALVAVAVEAWK